MRRNTLRYYALRGLRSHYGVDAGLLLTVNASQLLRCQGRGCRIDELRI